MSTKSTLVYGPGFHLYHECFEQDNVYLELEKTHFEYCPDRVTVAIPVVVWEVIRQLEGVDFSWAAKSDDEPLIFSKADHESYAMVDILTKLTYLR